MNRTEATAVYVVAMFALVAGAAQQWAVNSPRVKALIAAHHHTMTAPQAPELAQLDMPAMEGLQSFEDLQTARADRAVMAADRVQMAKAYKAAQVCNRTQIRLAMAQARVAARQFRMHQREMQRQWVMVSPASFNVRVQPAQVEISNP